jgi:hypothetical protein
VVCGHALATQRHCEPLSELRCAHTCAFTIARFPHVASDILPCDMLVVCVCVCVCVCCARTRARTTLTTMQKAMHACMQRYTQRDTLHVVLTSVLLLVDQYEYGQEPPGAHTSPFKRARFAPRICRLASSIGTGLTPGSGGATCTIEHAWSLLHGRTKPRVRMWQNVPMLCVLTRRYEVGLPTYSLLSHTP